MFKALGHPARLAIVEHLLRTPNCICGDLTEVTDLAQPTVSQHLKELKSAGIIKGKVLGRSVCYCINENVLSAITKLTSDFDHHLKSRETCC